MEVINFAQAQQMKSGETTSGSAADDAYTVVIFQPQICQTALLRPTTVDGNTAKLGLMENQL